MRKGIVLTARDYEVLRHLSYGPSTVKAIFKSFFGSNKKNVRTRERVMTRRLQKLKKGGLIKDQANPRLGDTIYILSPVGATHVADRFGAEVSNVWTHFPKTNDAYHDLIVAGLARRIIREGRGLKNYQLEFLLSECFLKKEHGGKKGLYYPDLRTGLTQSDLWTLFDVEVDCGTISKKDFVGKINSFENTILIVVMTDKRMNLLYRYLDAMATMKSVYMTFYENIVHKSFFGCTWYTTYSPQGTTLMIN